MAISSDTIDVQWFRSAFREQPLRSGIQTRVVIPNRYMFFACAYCPNSGGEWRIAVCATGSSSVLILTRRPKETICIGDEVRVTVLGIKGNQVRIGIEAPDAVAVHREEIYDRIQAEKAGQDSPE